MHVLFLAAGFGTRLKEFGETTPKGLIPSGKSTLLGTALADICTLRSDFRDLALVTNGKFSKVYGEWLETQNCGGDVALINDGSTKPEERLGAIGDILLVVGEKNWWDEDLLVIPSDTFYSFHMKDFLEFAKRHGGFATIFKDTPKEVIAGRLGCAVVEDDRVVSFVEKPIEPPSTFAAIPFYYYPSAVLKLLPEYKSSGGNMDAPGNIIPWLLSRQVPVYGYITRGETLDVGTMEDLKKIRSV